MQKLPLVFILSAVVPSWACTAAVVPFHDGLVIARSLEWSWFGGHDPEKIFFHPKGHTDDGADTGEPSNYGMDHGLHHNEFDRWQRSAIAKHCYARWHQ